jgi:hypothetical protein
MPDEKRHWFGWLLIFLFSPVFWLIGAAWQIISGQFCESWKGLAFWWHGRKRFAKLRSAGIP